MDDHTFAQLLADLREGPARIGQQVMGLPAERWDEVVHDGEGGWTRRQLLAHIAANDLRQLTRVRVGAGIGGPDDEVALAEQGDVDGWNQRHVDARAACSVTELLAEMHAHRRDLLALLERLTPEQRSRDMPFRGRLVPLTTMVPTLLEHLAFHAGQITS